MEVVISVMSIATGVIFLIDFAFAIKNTRITIVQTRTVVTWSDEVETRESKDKKDMIVTYYCDKMCVFPERKW